MEDLYGMPEGFGASSSNVFDRLHNDAQKRKEVKQAPEPSMEEPRRVGPRNKIEEDLMLRDKQLKAKLRAKCAEQKAKERAEFSGVPKINSKSRKLLDAPKEEMGETPVRTAEHVASMIRSKHLTNLSGVFKENESSVVDVKVNLSKFHLTEAIKESVAVAMPKESKPLSNIKSRMEAQPGPSEEAPEPEKYLHDEKNVVKRTMHWQKSKQMRIQKQFDDKQTHELDGCTFKPDLSKTLGKTNKASGKSRLSKKNSYSQAFLTRKSTEDRAYTCLSPSRSRVGYTTGFNLNTFATRAQPMLEYKGLSNQEIN